MKLAWLAFACTACSGLEQTTGTCGDGIVDTYEDCDSGPNCRDCSIDCSTVACDPGYACGVDKLCHAPGGRFPAAGASASPTFDVLGFGATDTDGDGYNDVVGLGRSSLVVLHGDAGGTLANESTAIIPALAGPPAVTHIDGDATLDLVIPTPDGLIAYTSPYGVLSPYPFPIEFEPDVMHPLPLQVISLDREFAVAILDFGGVVGVAIIDGTQHSMSGFGLPATICPGVIPSDLRPDLFDHYQVPVTFPALPTHVIALATKTGMLCAVELRPNPAFPAPGVAAYLPTSHAPGALLVNDRPVLARLQSGPCPSIVGVTSGVTEFKGSGSPGSCTFSGTRVLAVSGTPVGRVPLAPNAIASEGPDALALDTGIATISLTTGAGTMLFAATRTIDSVATLDVDGDGDIDVVYTTDNDGDLEVLYRYGTELPGATSPDPAGFLQVGLETQGIPRHLLTGDFDGDGIGDIVYTEVVDRGERLMIAFGTRDQVLPPKLVSTYNGVEATRTIHLASSSDPSGTKVDDMFVLDAPPSKDPTEAQLLTVLYGSPQRTLMPFFDPREGTDHGVFVGAVSGVFSTGMTKPYLDLVAVEITGPSGAQMWRIVSTPNGAMTPDPPIATTALGCTPAVPPVFCAQAGVLLPYRRDPAAPTDVLIGVDHLPSYDVVAIDPFQLAPKVISLATDPPMLEPDLSFRRAYVADIDGDGLRELIVGYGPGSDRMPSFDARGHVVTCTYDSVLACKTLDVLAGWSCIDAVPARIVEQQRFTPVATGSQDLAMLCRKDVGGPVPVNELFRLSHDSTGFHATAVLALPPTTRYVQVADVTGDGVDDVLAFVDVGQSTVLRVYPQCTSRDNLTKCPAAPMVVQ